MPNLQLPGPKAPFAVDANAASLDFLRAGCAEYGDLWAVPASAGSDPVWVLNDPQGIHTVLTKERPRYDKGLGFERVRMLLGDGLIVSDGEHWKQRRRMLQPAFGRRSIERMWQGFARCVEERLPRWEACAADGEPLDVSDEANRLGLRVILRAIFGEDLERLDALPGGNPFDLVVDTPERDLMFAMRFRQLWPVVEGCIARRRARLEAQGEDSEASDFLGAYLAARSKDTGEPLTGSGLVDELMTVLVAGHETSAATIAWSWSLLARHRPVQDALRRAVGEAGTPPAGAGPRQEPELAGRIVHETLRLYPPVWMFTRRAREDGTLLGYAIAAGTQVLICPYLLHRHPRYWDDPEQFDPARFSGGGGVSSRVAYQPFSSGPRRCAGDGFALAVVQRQLCWAASRFRLEPLDDAVPGLDPGINLRAAEPIRLGVSRA